MKLDYHGNKNNGNATIALITIIQKSLIINNRAIFPFVICVIPQIESIILTLKAGDTFAMIRDINKDGKKRSRCKQDADDIDKLIEKAICNQSFDLSCPSAQ